MVWSGSWGRRHFSISTITTVPRMKSWRSAAGGRGPLRGEHGITLTLAAGDVVVIPAGVAHKRISAGSDFVVVGAYPRGQEGYDICHGTREERLQVDRNIVASPPPHLIPSTAATVSHGPLARVIVGPAPALRWTSARAASPPREVPFRCVG